MRLASIFDNNIQPTLKKLDIGVSVSLSKTAKSFDILSIMMTIVYIETIDR